MSASDAARRVALWCCALGAATAFAQSAPSREQEQIRRLRQQVQQLQQEQSASAAAVQQASARSSELKAQLDAAERALQAARSAGGERSRSLADAQQALQTLRVEQAALLVSRDEARALLETSTRDVQTQRAERARQQAALLQRDAAAADLAMRLRTQAGGLQTCIANNDALHALGHELLGRYANKGVWEAASQNEPFLQLKRVALENLVSGYRDKLDQQALAPSPTPTPASPASQRAP